MHIARDLSASDVRHDAIGAKVVATVDDIHPSVGITCSRLRCIFIDIEIIFGLIYIKTAVFFVAALFDFLSALDDFLNLALKRRDITSAEHDVNVGESFLYVFFHAFLLRHTTHNRQNKIGVALFFGFCHADIAERAPLCRIANTAGVEHDNVGIFGFGAIAIAHIFKNTGDFLAFVNVHLATVRVDLVILCHLIPFACEVARLLLYASARICTYAHATVEYTLYIIFKDKTIINSMKKTKNSKILSEDEQKRKKRKIITTVSAVMLTPMLCFALAIGGFALWAKSQQPDENLLPTATAAPVFYDSDGQELPYTEDNYINPEDLPDDLKNAFIALEDKRFYTHKGYDPVRMAGALFSNIKSHSLKEGASTITQQLVKNTHLSHEKTVNRKLKEIAIASNLEKQHSKDEILAMYLSVIYFGNGAYGVKQAAKLYFDKNLDELSLCECATLAGIVKNPKKYSPFSSESDCKARRNLVLSVMKKEGYIDQNTFEKAASSPLISIARTSENRNLNGRIFDLYIKCAIDEVCYKLDITKYELSNSALKIYLNVNSNLQRQIASVGRNKNLYSTDKISGAILVLDNKTHAVSAYWSNLPYEVKRQAGSSLKPLAVYAPALDMNAVTLATPIVDEHVTFGDFSPSNYGGIYYGDTTIRQAIKKSMNSVAVKTMSYIGVEKSAEYLNNVGISTTSADQNYALSLGAISNGVSVKQLADAYSTFANAGYFQQSNFVNYVVQNDRKLLSNEQNNSQKVLKSATCDQINLALSDTVRDGTAISLSALDFEVCAKTGTAERQDKKNGDAWCASYNDDFTIIVWHGFDDGMDEKGGGFATLQCQKAWQCASKLGVCKHISKSEASVVLDVDLYATKQNRSVTIASENTPIEYRKAEIFSADSTFEMSSIFDNVPKEKSDFTLSKNASNVTLTLNVEEIYSYSIYREDLFGRTQIASIIGKDNVGECMVCDTPFAILSPVKYTIECRITSNEAAVAATEKEIYLPSA